MTRLKTIASLLLITLSVSAKDYVITDYGVRNDSTRLQTEAIQKIIDKASLEVAARS